jgi:heptaprenyl diphosphate synthase
VKAVDQLRLPGLGEGLDRVERSLRRAVTIEDEFLSGVAGHLIGAGGKRIRPLLTLGATLATGSEATDDAVQGAVSVELVHLGSLYHDDVIDDAGSRRGTESVNHRWGNLVAILAGDFLLAKASEIAAALGTEVAALLARTIGQLCQGEVSQLRFAFRTDRPESAYLQAIAGKTASLMSTSTRIGALVTGSPRPMVEALTAYGHAVGMTFQIWDDIRDLVATEEALGKPAGHDMVEGTYTLPVIRALAAPGIGEELRSLLGGPLDEPGRDKARDLILSGDGVLEATIEARRWATVAQEALYPVRTEGPPEVLEALALLGHRLVDELPVL